MILQSYTSLFTIHNYDGEFITNEDIEVESVSRNLASATAYQKLKEKYGSKIAVLHQGTALTSNIKEAIRIQIEAINTY